jgi:hypothetical protein
MTCTKAINFGLLPRAIDVKDGNLVVGLRSGSIVECNLESEEMKTVMQGHNDGEVWGLDMANGLVITTGDDNQVKTWDPNSRKCTGTAIVNSVERKARKNKASTLGQYPDS